MLLRIVLALCALLAAAAGGVAVTRPDGGTSAACVAPRGIASISFSATKYPNVRRHYDAALTGGWPSVLVLNRTGADTRRARLLRGFGVRSGMDRDEYPPAVARSGWRADVAYVPSAENRSHGAVLGIKLRRFCNGTRFRYVFY